MKPFLTLALFAAATCSLAAQRYEPVAQKPMPKPAAQKFEPAQLPSEPLAEPVRDYEPVVLATPAIAVEGGAGGEVAVEDPASGEPGLAERRGPVAVEEPVPFDPVADKGLAVQLHVEQQKELSLKIEAPEAGVFLGLVLAAVKDSRFSYPGMPELLLADAIVASGIGDGTIGFDMGRVELGFPIYLQALVINERVAGASPITMWKPMP